MRHSLCQLQALHAPPIPTRNPTCPIIQFIQFIQYAEVIEVNKVKRYC